MEKIVLLLSLFAVGTFAYCPLWNCGNDVYRATDYNDCTAKVDAAEVCVKDVLAQDDICEECDKYDYNYHAGPGFVEGKRGTCLRMQCQRRELSQCLRKLPGLFMFYDTSGVDEIISCIKQWNPTPGRSKCLETLHRVEIPDSVKPLEMITQILTEMKAGCDPVIPVVECRKELAALSPFMMGPGKPPSRDLVQGVIDGMMTCVGTAIKKYPCKTLEGLLPDIKDMISKSVAAAFMRGPGGHGLPGGPANLYDLNCAKNDDVEAILAKIFKR